MTIHAKDLAYPVLCLSHSHGVLHYARHADELLQCSAHALNTGFYRHMEIVASDTCRYRVQAAKKVATVGPWWRFGQTLRVALTLEPLPVYSVGALKSQLLQALEASEFYDADPETKQLVQSSVDWPNLVAQLARNFYQAY